MSDEARLTCTDCSGVLPASSPVWRCECGGLLDMERQLRFEPSRTAARKPNMWRYREAIPIDNDANIVSFEEGYTPLLKQELRGREVFFKQDHLFQTGSYKDRGASVLVSKAKELGVREVVEDSSGNAGCAIAAYCAAAGIRRHIYVPAGTSPAKLAQIHSYGAVLHEVPGSRHDAAEAALEAARDCYYASHSWNPFFLQGTKTFAYEVCEQLDWRSPDALIAPVGNGTLLLGAHLGFEELRLAGHIARIPRLIAVQSENCAPLARAHQAGLREAVRVEQRSTLAEGIAIANPVRGGQILAAVRSSGGRFVTVSEDQIIAALRQMCALGYYIEPTSAAAVAGASKYLDSVEGEPVVVSALTGHGLKATEKIVSRLS